uniref:ATP-binding protein n=1 Tax=Holdemanella biformis TaxID=1735 RepID=UPI00265F3F42|nr:ATP-binding protein [Holdemanella biformis]
MENLIYFAINKERSDIKQELDYAMRQLDSDSPFFKDDLYKKYFTLNYTQFLTGNEESWLEEHGGIRIGFLDNNPVVFSMDKKSGEIHGTLSEYISYAKDCLGNHTLKFDIEAFDDYDKMIEALQNNEIDVIYYASRNSNVAEKKGYALSNTAWTYNLIAVTNKEDFNENDSYVVAVPKNKVALKQHIAYNYPHWKLVDCDSIEDGANMVDDGKVDCFIMGSSQVLSFDSKKNFKIIPLTKTMEACFAVKDGQATLLSILNKTIKAMPSDMLTSAIAMYDSTAYKTTFYSFLKDHLVIVLVLGFSIIIVILLLLQKARRAEASAKVALKSAEDASLAKTQFLHNVSHDIRTPMNAILGYSELMDNELKDNDLPRVFEHLNKLQKAGNILLSIINNVLDMARIESGKMELDENYEVVGNITQLVCSAFAVEASRKNIEFNIIVNVEHKHIIVDSTKMQEILSNLISNAIKYTSAGGKVTIDTKELPYDKEGYVLIQTKVSDTGIGMSEDFLPSLFELFTRERNTTLSKIPGTGLGMAIVKNFVDLMNGSIEVESELGKGSTFTITIPHKIANKDYTNRNIESSNEFDIDFMGKRILLAEDNELNAEITTTILSEMGFEVKAVEDGILCVNEIQHQPANTYDLILMDIQMPNMDGYKATHCIRRLSQPEKANIPIIAMSANAFEEDKKKAFDVKMNDYITKPIDFQKMEQVLKHILSK